MRTYRLPKHWLDQIPTEGVVDIEFDHPAHYTLRNVHVKEGIFQASAGVDLEGVVRITLPLLAQYRIERKG